MHKPFNLHSRPTTKKNKQIYYCQFYDEDGNRLTARSTGQTSKAAAENWAYEQLQRGIISSDKNVTFGKYAEKWWLWEDTMIAGKVGKSGEACSEAFRRA